jgi:hypothetical protein
MMVMRRPLLAPIFLMPFHDGPFSCVIAAGVLWINKREIESRIPGDQQLMEGLIGPTAHTQSRKTSYECCQSPRSYIAHFLSSAHAERCNFQMELADSRMYFLNGGGGKAVCTCGGRWISLPRPQQPEIWAFCFAAARAASPHLTIDSENRV